MVVKFGNMSQSTPNNAAMGPKKKGCQKASDGGTQSVVDFTLHRVCVCVCVARILWLHGDMTTFSRDRIATLLREMDDACQGDPESQ
jgi:hypothetical protein